MSRFDRVLAWIENFLAASSLAAAAAISIAGVIVRFVFGGGIFWAEEAVIFLVIFSTFVGAAIVLRHDEHVNVDILPVVSGERGRWLFRLLGTGLLLLYCAVIGGYGWLLVTQPAARATVTPAPDLPLWFVELALPIGLTLMFIRALEAVYRMARGRQTFPEAERSELEESMPEESLEVSADANAGGPAYDEREGGGER